MNTTMSTLLGGPLAQPNGSELSVEAMFKQILSVVEKSVSDKEINYQIFNLIFFQEPRRSRTQTRVSRASNCQ